METILVTGGAGYIGSHVCKALSAAGFSPLVFDNLATGHRWAVQWGPFEEGDLADLPLLNRVFARHRPAAVLHLAGSAYVEESVSDPLKYYRNNVAGTLNLLAAMIRAGVRHLVFSSSCTVYAANGAKPLAEAHPIAPASPYGASKSMIERILSDFRMGHAIQSVSLRFFNAAGADPEGESGEAHDPETHLIPRALMAAAGEMDHIEIYGTRYHTPDGTCIRDYVHVSDLADGHVGALAGLLEGRSPPCLNLGSGRGYSVREVVAAVQKVTGRTLAVREAAPRPGDNAVIVADSGLARRVLGFAPRYTALEDIVGTAWEWFQKSRSPGGFRGDGRPAADNRPCA